MTKFRKNLPQMHGKDMLQAWGMGTWLQFVDGIEAPHFATFRWLNDPKALAALRDYHRKVIEAAMPYGIGILTDGLHYRASRDWGELIGYSREALAEVNFKGIEFCRELAREFETPDYPMPLCGAIGPRGDAYNVGNTPNASEAEDYHAEQIETLKQAGADLIIAATFSSIDEAVGVVRAAKALEMPVSVSFTLNSGGVMASGRTLQEAIEQTDAATEGAVAYYTTNCSHPLEFEPALKPGAWLDRLYGFMPNAVSLDKGTLCKLGHLEDGDPKELGQQMGDLARRFPHMRVWGGCCGTDARHIGEICRNIDAVRAEPAT
jgi:homocysteine S-methyltransferase